MKQLEEATVELDSVKSQLDSAESQLQASDASRVGLLEEIEEKHRQKIKAMEEEFETRAGEQKAEMEANTEAAKIQLDQVKSLFEIDKENLLARIQEEKDRASRQLASYSDENDSKFREEQMQHEEAIEMLQEQLQEQEA